MVELIQEQMRRILRAKKTLTTTGLSRSELYRKTNDPDDDFPAAVRLSEHSIGWYEDEILTWCETRPRTKPVEATAHDGPIAA